MAERSLLFKYKEKKDTIIGGIKIKEKKLLFKKKKKL
jgi:hypothetical protein